MLKFKQSTIDAILETKKSLNSLEYIKNLVDKDRNRNEDDYFLDHYYYLRSVIESKIPKMFDTIIAHQNTIDDLINRNFELMRQLDGNWIPCSERLPSDEDYDETFTVTIQCEHHDGWDDYVTGYAEWTPHGWDIQSYYIGQIKVVAWMPLPKPYTEKED